jgi:hypothetical protein
MKKSLPSLSCGFASTLIAIASLCLLSTVAVMADTINQEVQAPDGLVGWWKGQSNVMDSVGGNNGYLTNGASYDLGKVGAGFSLDGIDGCAVVPNANALNFGSNQNFSIEAWIQAEPTPNNTYGLTVIAQKSYTPDTSQSLGWGLFMENGRLGFLLCPAPMSSANSMHWTAFDTALEDGLFHHVAATLDRKSASVGKLYVDGNVVLTFDLSAYSGDLSNNSPLYIGRHDNASINAYFKGIIDEVSVYNRALTENEISNIYLASNAGKSTQPSAPVIVGQPASQQICPGKNANLNVGVSGTPPLYFQWSFNGTQIESATNYSLTVTNFQAVNEGLYAVTVTNNLGSAISSNALLSIKNPITAPQGLLGWWKGESNILDSAGNANGYLTNGASFDTGQVGTGLSFDGLGSQVIITNVKSFNFGTNQNFSVEAWIKAQSPLDYSSRTIVTKAVTPDSSRSVGWALSLQSGTLVFQLSQGPLNQYNISQWSAYTINIQDGNFHHVAVTLNRNSYTGGKFYVDGVLVQTFDPTSESGDLSTDGPLYIGGPDNPSLNTFFKGVIDELSIYNRELSDADISAIYQAENVGKAQGNVAPSIAVQPASQEILVGYQAVLDVGVIGAQPLSYQWNFNGTNIDCATNLSLTVTNFQPVNAGSYAVVVSNSFGSVTSSNAVLSIKQPILAPQGMVAWWRGESNILDSAGNANGYLTNGASFDRGMVGTGFGFDRLDSQVVVPSARSMNFNTNQNFSVEAWIKAQPTPDNPYATRNIVIKANTANSGKSVGWALSLQSGMLAFQLSQAPLSEGSVSQWYASKPNLQDGIFHHVAATLNRASRTGGKLYIDGALVKTFDPTLENGDLSTDGPLFIGGPDNPSVNSFFKGVVDEVSIYNRELSSTDISAIYQAAIVGKTMEPAAPSIVGQPQSQEVLLGGNVTMDVGVVGVQPFKFQWSFNGANIDGATNLSHTITNFQSLNEGAYAVLVSNTLGSMMSSNALITLKKPIVAPDGLVGWWKGDGCVMDSISHSIGYLTNGAGYAPGMVQDGFDFDGISGYATIPDSSSLNFSNKQSFSVETWIKAQPTSGSTYGIAVIAQKATTPDASQSLGWQLYMERGRLGIMLATAPMSSSNSRHWTSSSINNLQDGKFHHVAATLNRVSSTGGKLYVDGAVVLTFDPTSSYGDLSCSGPLYIGRHDNSTIKAFFKGIVDELSIYNRELSTAEIQTIYQAGEVGKAEKPFAPVIGSQPSNQIVALGGNVAFSLSVAGTEPLSYQWSFNGTNIVNATNKSLALANVQLSDAGVYAVVITNALGSVTSSNATLTVVPPITAAQGLVGWWRGESNVVDEFTGSTGYLTNGASYGSGEVGTGFRITGLNAQVIVPNAPELNFGSGQNFSVESWLKISSTPGRYNGLTYIADKSSGSDEVNRVGWRLLASSDNLWFIMSQSPLTNGSWSIWTATNVGILDGRFHHVAATVNRTSKTGGSIYVDGHLIMSFDPTSQCGDLSNNGPLRIGNSDDMHDTGEFDGIIDEVTVYNRALASNEIAAISQAGVGGKNLEPSAPIIVQQPSSQRIVQGNDVTFQVGAGGTQPLGFQWLFNGANIAGGTNSWLTLTNIQFAQAGAYSVQITNILGTVMSSNATLRVDYPPATVLIANVTGSASAPITVPVLLQANGNENAVSFSVNFDPTVLAYANVGIGSGATRGSLFINTNLVASGKLGVILALPSGSVFSAGTQEVVSVAFNITTTQAGSSAVTLGNQPTLSQLSDVEASILAANYAGATVTIAAADFEGDVTPRPNGDKNVTLTDWVQEGRYVARLDNPAGASEYQRADCAPQSTRGDGAITVLDWVQAGRYAVGLDRLVPVGGPTADIVPIEPLDNHSSLITESTSGCEVKIVEMSLVQGRSGTVSVVMEAQGTENAAGFSLAFDPTTISFLNASLGSAATGAMVNVNTNDVASGHVGFALALSPGQTFGTGTKEILKLSVQVAASAATGQSLFTFTDVPVTKVVSDTTAMAVNATFTQGVVDVSSSIPALRISRLSDQVVLAWPDWATNYVLQISGNAGANLNWTNSVAPSTLTNSEYVVALPVSAEAQFYRLIQSGIQNILMTPASTGSTNTTIIKK